MGCFLLRNDIIDCLARLISEEASRGAAANGADEISVKGKRAYSRLSGCWGRNRQGLSQGGGTGERVSKGRPVPQSTSPT